MAFSVIWVQLPGRMEMRKATFTSFADAEYEAENYALSVSGTVETVILDQDGAELYLAVRSNAQV